MKKIFGVLAMLVFSSAMAFAVTVEGVGEATIERNDTATAKLQAVARAKWAAMEEAAGVQVKTEVLVHNADLVDEAIKSEVRGVIESFKVIDEGVDGTTYWAKIRAEISKTKAQAAVGGLAKNTSIAVMIPVVFPDGRVEETHALSERIIGELGEQGFEVVDISANNDEQAERDMQSALKGQNFGVLKNIATRYMTNLMLIGKVKVVDKGKNIGYGTISFGIVNGEMDYRIIGTKGDKRVILANGTLTARGQGATVEAAAYSMLQNLAEESTNAIVNTIADKLKGEAKRKIRVSMTGNSSLDDLMELKQDLQNIAWVLSVDEQGKDAVIVEYPEKTLYLASFINSNGKYTIKKLGKDEIVLTKN